MADEIAKGEGTYTSVNTGGNPKKRVDGDFQSKNLPNLTNMTIDEILKKNKLPIGDSDRINAAGRYQVISSTLESAKNEMKLSGKEKFTPEMQDRIFMHLLPQAAKDYADGKHINKNKAISSISNMWSSVANPRTGKTSHQDGVNKASSGSIKRVGDALDAARTSKNSAVNPAPQANAKNAKETLAQQAEFLMHNSNPQASILNVRPAENPAVSRTNSFASFTPPKVNTHVEPAKEYLTLPSPQQVVVMNQNSGNINQNVSDRMLAHAITGGLGMGANSWDA